MLDQDRPTQSSSFAIGKRIARARSRVNRARVRVERRLLAHESLPENHSRIYIYYFFFFFFFNIFVSFVTLPSGGRLCLVVPLRLLRSPFLTFSPSHALSFSFSHLGITNLRFVNPFISTISRFTLAPASSLSSHPFTGGDRRRNSQCRFPVPVPNRFLLDQLGDKLLMQVCLLRTIGALQPSKNLVQRIMYLYLVRIFCDSIRSIRSERNC